MKYSEVLTEIADTTKIDREAVKVVINTLTDIIIQAVSNGDTVNIPGFCTFSQSVRLPKRVIHPVSKQKITTKGKVVMRSISSKSVNETLTEKHKADEELRRIINEIDSKT